MIKRRSLLKIIAISTVPVLAAIQVSAQTTQEKAVTTVQIGPNNFDKPVAVTNVNGKLYWFKRSANANKWVESSAPALSEPSEVSEQTVQSEASQATVSGSLVSAQAVHLINWNYLIDVNFGNSLTKTGYAAVGFSSSDYWNVYHYPYNYDVTLVNLAYTDNTSSGVSMRVQNAPGEWGNSTGDAMYDSYSYNEPGSGNISITFSNLPHCYYDLYVYGHGAANNQNGVYTLNGVSLSTAEGAYWNNNQLTNGNFIEGAHYVAFRSVAATNGGTVALTVSPDAGGYPLINGLQLVIRPEVLINIDAKVAGIFAGHGYPNNIAELGVTCTSTNSDCYSASLTILEQDKSIWPNTTWGTPYWASFGAGQYYYSITNYIPMKKFWATDDAYYSDTTTNKYSLLPIAGTNTVNMPILCVGGRHYQVDQ